MSSSTSISPPTYSEAVTGNISPGPQRQAPPLPPPMPLSKALRSVVATHGFHPASDEELGFVAGNVLQILDENADNGWYMAKCGKSTGLVPGTLIKNAASDVMEAEPNLLQSPLKVKGGKNETVPKPLPDPIPKPTMVYELMSHKHTVKAVAFSPTSPLLVSVCKNGRVAYWDVTTGTSLAIRDISSALECVTFSADGNLLALGTTYAGMGLCDSRTPSSVITWKTLKHTVNSVSFSSDGRMLAAGLSKGSICGEIQVWDVRKMSVLSILEDSMGSLNQAAFCPNSANNDILASMSGLKTVRLWSVNQLRPLKTLSTSAWSYTAEVLAWSPEGTMFVTDGVNVSARLWKLSTGLLPSFQLKDKLAFSKDCSTTAIAFSPNGQTIAAVSDVEPRLIICKYGLRQTTTGWRGAPPFSPHGKSSGPFARTNRHLTLVAFSNDSELVAMGSTSNTVKIWKVNC